MVTVRKTVDPSQAEADMWAEAFSGQSNDDDLIEELEEGAEWQSRPGYKFCPHCGEKLPRLET